ncbi:ribulose-phosphate 3-epimerase [Enorma phocaeensis]|uniref:Ribulose-phosphate 3-epimerase n=1 Tax=Enorma phocaeensis TaxID=1871019 RepID=A0ABT7V621_9ACTN|nr:ribulose-phosphate 3-epimerase [Enorma phocaeensis]MDM8273946.1 ribulose-phosphate 3-epimerase [Enorma phocaeensis]
MSAPVVRVAPSILSADLLNLGRDLEAISGADFIHIDVMDGHFTPNLTFGVDTVKACKRASTVPLDVHMMVTNPDESVSWYLDAGADMVTVHLEAARHPHRIVSEIHAAGAQAGVVLNPGTPACALDSILEDVDMVLLMSVDPGFGGQSFIEGTIRKISQVRSMARERGKDLLIEVDGGVSAANVERVVAAGADVIVAGSAVFGSADPAREVARLRELGTPGLAAWNA